MCRPQCRSTKQNALEPNSQWAMYGKVCNCVGIGWGVGLGRASGAAHPHSYSYPQSPPSLLSALTTHICSHSRLMTHDDTHNLAPIRTYKFSENIRT